MSYLTFTASAGSLGPRLSLKQLLVARQHLAFGMRVFVCVSECFLCFKEF